MSNMAMCKCETKRVSELLEIKCPKLKFVNNLQDTPDFIKNENGEYTVLIGAELGMNGQVTHIIRSARLIWAEQHQDCVPSIEDSICFEVGYRAFVHKELVTYSYTGNQEVDTFVERYIKTISKHVSLYGTQENDLQRWIREARRVQLLPPVKNN